MDSIPSSQRALEIIRAKLSGSEAEEVTRFLQDNERFRKFQTLEFNTTIEIANQINSKGLDSRAIEQYAVQTVRGRFGVSQVAMLRQDDLGGEYIADRPMRPDDEEDGTPLRFRLNSALARELLRMRKPFALNRSGVDFDSFDEVAVWKRRGFLLAVPLIRGDGELKGLLLMGPKINRDDYNERDFNFLGLLGTMIGIALHNAQLYMRSILDSLTLVFTRGHFDIQLAQEVDRLKRYDQSVGEQKRCVSLIMLDVDHFKQFNDRYGHQIGDQVLVHLAQILKTNVRSMDVVARYGGEEFALICPETAKPNSALLCERLRQAIEQTPLHTNEFGRLNITASLGVATYPDDAAQTRELIRQADTALYRAKALGRNRTTLAPDGAPVPETEGNRS